MSSEPPRSPSYDPSVEDIEQRVFTYDPNDPEWEDDDEDDDDMDYEPAEEGNEDEGDDEDFHDAEEGFSGVDIEFQVEGGGDVEAESGTAQAEANTATRQPARVVVTRDHLMQLLGHGTFRTLFANRAYGAAAADDDEDDTFTPRSRGTRSSRPRGPKTFETVPSEKGQQLMAEGTFGSNERPENSYETPSKDADDPYDSFRRRKKKLAYRLMRRELGLGSFGRQRTETKLLSHDLIPGDIADTIIHYNARCYSGQFSGDGNFFFSCAQDFKVRMYDTANPYNWKYYKTVDFPIGSWTITDASLSPDNKYLAASSIRSIVCLAHTDPSDTADPHLLDFSNTGTGSYHRAGRYSNFGIWSLRFSGDGREIVAGTGDHSVYVYDIERGHSILQIPGHDDDVNAVCYGDAASPHILYSGSDDTTLKVWDRRSLGDGRAAGVFLGHTEGLTYVDSKGDGRYILSNGKDQTAKLWDLRMVMSTEKARRINPQAHTTNFEYRQSRYDESLYSPHPHDCSAVTFRGHSVLKTLIRCHFSPPGSTDSRYVYSGSYDGKVYVWNMDATLKGTIDVLKATKNSRPRDPELLNQVDYYFGSHTGQWQTCVRDASWHPDAPIIAATSWNGWGNSLGTCTTHSFNSGLDDDEGAPPMGLRVNSKLQRDSEFYNDAPSGNSLYRRTRMARRMGIPDDDDDD